MPEQPTSKTNSDRCDSCLTIEDVETVIRKSIVENVKIIDYHVEAYSDKILGFMSSHQKLIVKVLAEGSTIEQTHTYFLKSMAYTTELHTQMIQDSKVFYKEANFYSKIMPELMKYSKDNSWAAQCYLAKEDVLVFENLQVKNYVLKERFFNVGLLKAALASMARMHAASMLVENQLGKVLTEAYPQVLNELFFLRDSPFSEWVQTGINMTAALADKLGFDRAQVLKMCNLAFEKVEPSTNRKNVLCHGDANTKNLMFADETKCALVDFQVIRYAPPMVDVAQLIHLNASREVRYEHETELLRHYHEVLRDVLTDGGMVSPSFDDIVSEYDEVRVVGIVTANLYFPIDFLDEKLLVEIMNDPTGIDDQFLQNRQELVFKSMEHSQKYRELVTSIVGELVELSQRVLK